MRAVLLLAGICFVLCNFPECKGCWVRPRRPPVTTPTRPTTRPNTRPTWPNTRPNTWPTRPTTRPNTRPTKGPTWPSWLTTRSTTRPTKGPTKGPSWPSWLTTRSTTRPTKGPTWPSWLTTRSTPRSTTRPTKGPTWPTTRSTNRPPITRSIIVKTSPKPGKCGNNQTDVIHQEHAVGEAVVDDVVWSIRNAGIFPDDHCLLRRIAYTESKFGNDVYTFLPKQGRPYYGGIWQVDEIGFNELKNVASHPSLTVKYAQIKDKLCIDWTRVVWRDLLKPLYSGLAARLYLFLKPAAIPADLEGQAKYWKRYYNTAAGAGTWEKFRDDILAFEHAGDCL